MGSPGSFSSYKSLRAKLRLFSIGYTVAIVTYTVVKMTIICSPIIRLLFDTIYSVTVLTDSVSIYSSKLKCRKVLETVASHLEIQRHPSYVAGNVEWRELCAMFCMTRAARITESNLMALGKSCTV